MLANGITLAVKKKGASEYVELQDLKEVPELGVDAEKVENTRLKDNFKHSELGIGDPGDMAYKFVYDNSSESSDYRVLRAIADTKEVASYRQTFPDGTKHEFDAYSSIKVGGGGVNAAIEFTLTLGLQSDIVVTDPTA